MCRGCAASLGPAAHPAPGYRRHTHSCRNAALIDSPGAGDGTFVDSGYDACTETISAEIFARVRMPQPALAATPTPVVAGLVNHAVKMNCCAFMHHRAYLI